MTIQGNLLAIAAVSPAPPGNFLGAASGVMCSVGKPRSTRSQRVGPPSLLKPGYEIKFSSPLVVKMKFPFTESINPWRSIFTLVVLLCVKPFFGGLCLLWD